MRSDRSYAIIGGLGDLGLLTAELMVEQDAGLVALIGRNPPTLVQQKQIDALEARGGKVLVLQADAADRNQLNVALEAVRGEMAT